MLLVRIVKKNYKFLLIFIGILVVLISPMMPFEMLLLSIGLLSALIIYEKPKKSITLMLVLLPFSNTVFLAAQPVSAIPLRLFVIIFIGLFGLVFVKYKMNVKTSYDYMSLFLFSLYIIIFTISIVKSIDYIDAISRVWDDNFSIVRLFNSFWISPMVMLIPGIIIYLYFNYEDYGKIIDAFIISMLILSIFILLLYILVIPNKTDFSSIRGELGQYIGLHGNGIADFFIITFPLLFVVFMNSSKTIVKITFYCSLLAIAILFSRTAYICVVFTFFIYSFYRRTLDKRFVGLLGALSVMLVFLPQSVYDRFLTLSASGDINTVTAGRTDDIWFPLWFEWLQKTDVIKFFGTGRYAIVESFVFRNGVILDVSHPHNMYLEALIDIGIIGLVIYLAVYFAFALQAFKVFIQKDTLQYDKDVLFGILLSFFLFLLSGLSGRTMFPTVTNSYLWVMIMMSVLIVRHYKENDSRWLEED